MRRLFFALVLLVANIATGMPLQVEQVDDENISIKNTVISAEPVESSWALLIASGKIVRKVDCGALNLGGGKWSLVSGSIPKEVAASAMILFIAKTASGGVVTTDVAPIESSLPIRGTVACLKDSSVLSPEALRAMSPEELRAFVRVKSELKRRLVRTLDQLLTPEMIQKLNDLERRYGLIQPRSISQTVSYEDLAYRIARIDALQGSE